MPYTRIQAAERIGVSLRRLRDLERAGTLRPYGKKGEPRIYSHAEIDRYLQVHPEKAARKVSRVRPAVHVASVSDATDGETAASIFAMLVAGKTKIQIVTELRCHPDVVEAIAMRFERMRRESDASIAPAPCAKCGQNAARFCGACLDV